MYYIEGIERNNIATYDLNPYGNKTVLFIHGWPLSHKMFEYQTNVLIDLGYRVVSIDLRGFGNSDEMAEGYDYASLASDVYCVVERLGLRNFILVGFSMGGAIAVKYMNLYQGYGVSKLCLWSAAVPSFARTPNNPYGMNKDQANKLIAQAYIDRPKLNEYFGSIFFAKPHSKAIKDWFQRMSDNSGSIAQIRTLESLRDEDVFEDMKKINVPTGIFHGRLDKICPYELSNIQRNHIKFSKLYTFEKGGHGTFFDELEKFNKNFIEYIEEK